MYKVCECCGFHKEMGERQRKCWDCIVAHRREWARNRRRLILEGKVKVKKRIKIKRPEPEIEVEEITEHIKDATFYINKGLWYWRSEKYNIESPYGFKTLREARYDCYNAIC